MAFLAGCAGSRRSCARDDIHPSRARFGGRLGMPPWCFHQLHRGGGGLEVRYG